MTTNCVLAYLKFDVDVLHVHALMEAVTSIEFYLFIYLASVTATISNWTSQFT